MTDWPCHAWLQKKVSPTNKATLRVYYHFYAPIWVMGFCVLYHQTIIFIGGNSVYQRWAICPLTSKSVSEMHFPGIWRPKFQNFPPWCPPWTHLTRYWLSKQYRNSIFEKNSCRQKCFYEKWLSVREGNVKLLLETVTYIAIKESHLHNYNRHSHLRNVLQKIPPA